MRNILYLLAIVMFFASCSKGKKEVPSPSPSAAVLVSPVNNEACITGVTVSATQSRVTFTWSAAANADSYVLTVTNLLSNTKQSLNSVLPNAELTLDLSTPYSWFVTSKSSKNTSTVNSPVWKFYNTGPGVSSFPPYPAELTSPGLGQTVTPSNGKITLTWKGSDADNDIANYDVYLGTSNTPALIKSQHLASPLTDVAVIANTTYYWKVITRDAKGNTSDSGVFEFKTN
jgi:hypothetical protein